MLVCLCSVLTNQQPSDCTSDRTSFNRLCHYSVNTFWQTEVKISHEAAQNASRLWFDGRHVGADNFEPQPMYCKYSPAVRRASGWMTLLCLLPGDSTSCMPSYTAKYTPKLGQSRTSVTADPRQRPAGGRSMSSILIILQLHFDPYSLITICSLG